MNPAVHKLPYDPLKSLIPIAQIASGGNVIATHPSFPAKTIKDLVALAKGKPGQIRYASSGIGGFNHFGGELFNMLAGVKLAHMAKRLSAEAAEPVVATPKAFGELIINDLAKWSRIAKQAGIRAE